LKSHTVTFCTSGTKRDGQAERVGWHVS